MLGGYRAQGRTADEAIRIIDLALEMQDAGAAAILLEAVPPEVSAAVVDSGNFKGAEEIDRLQNTTEDDLKKYVAWAQAQGFKADYRIALGTEAVRTVEEVCRQLAEEFPRAIFFMGRLIFREEKWYHRLLHNETPHAIQRRLQFAGIQAMVLPIRVLE